MFKKLTLAIVTAAAASFATWNYYPILPKSQFTLESSLYYDVDDEWSQFGAKIGFRYTILKNFEISFTECGFQLWGETDIAGYPNGGSGMRDGIVGGRYQLTPAWLAFLDLQLPIGTTSGGGTGITPPGSDEWALYGGAQYSKNLARNLTLGTELGLDWGFEHDKYQRGLETHLGAEAKYRITNSPFTPLAGLQFKLQLMESTYDSKSQDDLFDNQVNFWLGTAYALSYTSYVKAQVFARHGDMDGNAFGFYAAIGMDF